MWKMGNKVQKLINVIQKIRFKITIEVEDLMIN